MSRNDEAYRRGYLNGDHAANPFSRQAFENLAYAAGVCDRRAGKPCQPPTWGARAHRSPAAQGELLATVERQVAEAPRPQDRQLRLL